MKRTNLFLIFAFVFMVNVVGAMAYDMKGFEYSWGGSESDVINSIVIDSNNNIYVAGYQGSNSQGDDDFYVAKLDSNGNKLWEKSWGDNHKNYFTKMVISSDNIYI